MNGYRRHEHHLPPLPPPPWPPATAETQAMEQAHFEALELAVQFEATAKPWTLTRLPGESWLWVAARRSLWMRLRTWWLNRKRREEHARHMAYLVAPKARE